MASERCLRWPARSLLNNDLVVSRFQPIGDESFQSFDFRLLEATAIATEAAVLATGDFHQKRQVLAMQWEVRTSSLGRCPPRVVDAGTRCDTNRGGAARQMVGKITGKASSG
jgi:hypothetical protein